MNKIFVGNLSFKATQDEVRDAFSAFGTVVSVAIPTDKETGRPRGFAFVEMASEAEAQAAIDGMNNKEIGGRPVATSLARPKA